jgi:WYL domain
MTTAAVRYAPARSLYEVKAVAIYDIVEGFRVSVRTAIRLPPNLAVGAFGLIDGPRTQVPIFFDHEVAGFVRRRQWHPTQEIKLVPGGIELTMEVCSTVELAGWVLDFGNQADVIEPGSNRDQLAAELERAATRYSGASSNERHEGNASVAVGI